MTPTIIDDTLHPHPQADIGPNSCDFELIASLAFHNSLFLGFKTALRFTTILSVGVLHIIYLFLLKRFRDGLQVLSLGGIR